MPQKRTTPKGTVYWVARWTDAGGTPRHESFPTRREAKEHEDVQKLNVRRGEWVPSDDGRATVSELACRWRDAAETQGTWDERDSLVKNLGLLVDLPARGVRPEDLSEWVGHLIEGRPWMDGRPLAASTARNKRSQLSGIMGRATQDGIIARSPFTSDVRKISAPVNEDSEDEDDLVVDQLLTLGQIKTMIDAAEHGHEWEEAVKVGRRKVTIDKSTRRSLAGATLIHLGVGTGVRAGEAGGFNVEDWDQEAGILRVRRQSKIKAVGTRKLKTPAARRDLPVSDVTGEAIERYLSAHPPKGVDGPLVRTMRGTRWTARAIGGRIRSLRPAVGLEWPRFHDLRHFYATSQIAGGMSVPAVQELLGHASPVTTLTVYAHFWPGDMDRARDVIGGVLGEWGNRGEMGKPDLRVVGD